jgi:protein SCO1
MLATMALTILMAGGSPMGCHPWAYSATLVSPPAATGGRLPVIRDAADFQLIDAAEKPVSLRQFRGKAALVSFIFTTCSGACPATTHRLAKIHEALAKTPLADRVQLISISLDPERDTPAKLRDYMRLYDIEGRGWSFLTGPPPEVRRVLDAWHMWARPAANGQLDHPSRVFLVDPEGRVREIYNLDFLRVPWVVEDIEEVLR